MEQPMFLRVLRGDIFYVDFGHADGSPIHGIRPAMVVQNDVGNWHSTTVIVAAITTVLKATRQPTHVYIGDRFGLPRKSMLMLEQLFTVDKVSLKEYLGTVDDDFLDLVDEAAAISLGVHPTKCNSRNGNQPMVRDYLMKVRRKDNGRKEL